MIMALLTGRYAMIDNNTIQIGRSTVICGNDDLRSSNYKEGDIATMLCLYEDGKFYFRYAEKNPNIFFATGVLNGVRPSSKPEYCKIDIIEEDLLDSGNGFTTHTATFIMPVDSEDYKRLRKLRLGDAVSMVGTVTVGRDGVPYMMVQAMDSVNAFVVLTGLERQLPFDDLRKGFELSEKDLKEGF